MTSKIALSRIAIDEEIRARVLAFVDSGWYILGPESNAFERAQILSLPIFPTLTDAEADRVADAVAGVRRTREDDWVKRLSSRVGNGFRNAVTGVRVSDAGCTYRALRREALAECRCSTACTASCPRCSSSRAIA